MESPKVADLNPWVSTLEPGSYYWCSCGLSTGQPFCDGSHQGTQFTPVSFEVSDSKKVALCQCKATQNPPFCDGSHNNLETS
ncbi:Glutamate synthase [NADPH] large chain [Geitlerinema sp. FC II]|uniref:CDGSH iron-sulfur domain-containing protein n=1 Tax=Baaleninema simplex TaxID=2862350 RepID=UPI0003453E35|nr:CDGSH iron-sulfur domain-containing protein [Baaleninema simplex]MDC0833411.1 CDGSH iron-sulfur domain-containing protein [Geitlerinema sp. CS-897]PPT07606.1 Glutamate synthase [NADPH] large chain [Geitlerinema sp. FC II]